MGCRSIQPHGKALPSFLALDLSSGERIATSSLGAHPHVQGAELEHKGNPSLQKN